MTDTRTGVHVYRVGDWSSFDKCASEEAAPSLVMQRCAQWFRGETDSVDPEMSAFIREQHRALMQKHLELQRAIAGALRTISECANKATEDLHCAGSLSEMYERGLRLGEFRGLDAAAELLRNAQLDGLA